jgi:hypothetical protein
MIDEHDISLLDSIGENTIIHPGVEILVENRQGDDRGIFIGSDTSSIPETGWCWGI